MFSSKTAIVTGGSRGIGRAIVQALARTGARVVFTYLQNKSAADEITNNDTIIGLPVDVTRFDQAKELVKQVKERFGRIRPFDDCGGPRHVRRAAPDRVHPVDRADQEVGICLAGVGEVLAADEDAER